MTIPYDEAAQLTATLKREEHLIRVALTVETMRVVRSLCETLDVETHMVFMLICRFR